MAVSRADASFGTVRREISIDELGFRRGLEFTGFGGSQTLYFPIPETGLLSATLKLRLRSGSAFRSRRSVQIRIADSIATTRALSQQDEEMAIELAVDLTTVEGRFLEVTIAYSGAVTEDRCLDERVSGDFVAVLPDSGLSLELAPAAIADVRSVLALMPQDVTILAPGEALTETESAAILRIASMLLARNASVSYATYERGGLEEVSPGRDWAEGRIIVATGVDAPANPEDGTSTVSVFDTADGPALLVDGSDPAPGAAFLASRWEALASASRLSVETVTESRPEGTDLSFADLGMNLATQSLVDRAVFDVGFKATNLPAGMQPARLDLDLAIGDDFEETNATIAAFMNGSLLATTVTPGAVPATLSATIPTGLFHQANSIRVVVQRQPLTGDCANPPQSFPVLLLPSSSLSLREGNARPRDFFELTSAFGNGVTIFLARETDDRTVLWPGLARIVADLVPPAAAVDVRFGLPAENETQPFILVSPTLPEAISAPVRLDAGRILVTGPGDTTLLDADGLTRQGLAEIVHTSETTGLWIHPGSDGLAAGPGTAGLDRGNVAFLEQGAVTFAFSTERDRLVEVIYPERTSYLALARQYRPWLIGAGWLILTVVFVLGLSRYYRRRSG